MINKKQGRITIVTDPLQIQEYTQNVELKLNQ